MGFICASVFIRKYMQCEGTYFPFLCFSSIGFKALFVRLKVQIRFQALRNESNIICCVVEIHQ